MFTSLFVLENFCLNHLQTPEAKGWVTFWRNGVTQKFNNNGFLIKGVKILWINFTALDC